MQFAQNVVLMNRAEMDMAAITGTAPNITPIPQAPNPPIHYNNQSVAVSGGTAGAINFGNVEEINSSVHGLTGAGEVAIADALSKLTSAVLNAEDQAAETKNVLLEQIAFVSAQANLSAKDRKPGLLKGVLSNLKDGLAVFNDGATAWQMLAPTVAAYFQLG